jgi:sec-independent protein translocase protein TatC
MMKARLKNQQPSQQIKNPSSEHSAGTTFSDHVVELRNRAMWVGLVFIICSALAYNYHEALLKVIMAPLDGSKLIYLTPGGGFSFIFLVSMYTGLLASIPLLIYHLHAFIKPALPSRARRSAVKIILSATALIISGVAYGYFIAIPAALHFLTTFAGDAVTPNLTADSYLNFFLAYVAGLAVLSLLPLLLMFVHWIRPLKPGGLIKSERWVILFAFVAAALITPTPDVVNQSMIALPVIGIYQLGVFAVLVATLKEKRRTRVLARRQEREEKSQQVPVTAPAVVPIATQSQLSSVPQSPVLTGNVTMPSVPLVSPTRTVRSVDGFRPQKQIRVAPRSAKIQPRSMDGMTLRRRQMPQN